MKVPLLSISIFVTQLGLALLEGIGLILSPCILPILPIMLAASLDGGKGPRPLGIITGFIGAFTGFALLSRANSRSASRSIPRSCAMWHLVSWCCSASSCCRRNCRTNCLASRKGWPISDRDPGGALGQQEKFRERHRHRRTHRAHLRRPCAGPIMAAAIVQIIQAKTSILRRRLRWRCSRWARKIANAAHCLFCSGDSVMNRLTFLKTHSYCRTARDAASSLSRSLRCFDIFGRGCTVDRRFRPSSSHRSRSCRRSRKKPKPHAAPILIPRRKLPAFRTGSIHRR